jgi:bifunctional DNA-binding transcriptional regulator/antitoxin component of YhaV-PrlF toxin-antitoxin module
MEIIALPQGHVVLPLEICRKLEIEAGMRLEIEFDRKTGCIRLRPINHGHVLGNEREKLKPKRKPLEKKRLK